MRAVLVAGVCALLGCAGSSPLADMVDGHMQATDSAGGGCQTTLTANPAMPTADPIATIRVVAVTNVGGVPTYSWHISGPLGMVSATPASADGSQIDFIGADTGPYVVSVDIVGSGVFCATETVSVPVGAPGAHVVDYRLRVTPPSTVAPPQDVIVQVHGGADFTRSLTLDPGITVSGTVRDGGAGVPAYLRFMPAASPTAVVETFTQLDGAFSVQLLGQQHDVLIVPTVAGIAPRVIPWMPGSTSFTVSAGTAVSGVVRDAANAALAGAKVRITTNGVPSTLATTAADGSFTVRAMTVANATVDVEVTPPPGRGLARLHATGVLDLAQSVQIHYTGTTCDLANTQIKRATANLPSANVIVVGTLASAATVVAGITVTASGDVRIPASADGTGKLPSVLVPRAALSAVVSIAPGDLAVAPIDVTACPAITINAPVLVATSGTVKDSQLATLQGVLVEASPIGALALADALPIQTRTDVSGAFNFGLASGGHYDVRFVDPAGRGAPFVALGQVAGMVPTSIQLPLALHVQGEVSVPNNPNPVVGASVQILCIGCTGVAAARPIGEASTDSTSHYRIAVPDPGTM
ncbi:MAG: hypothetical protein JWO36_2089 [Myxococcales bacterium]|nr:hypothetical protein [Myxococcales bacterium]